MPAPSRGGSAVSALLKTSTRRAQVCSQCRSNGITTSSNTTRPTTTPSQRAPLNAARRFYSSEATAAATSTPSSFTQPPPLSEQQQQTEPATATTTGRFRIKSGIILTRPPLLTRTLTPFESSFFLYQKRLNERLAAPFRSSFYFKTDTAADLDWRIKLKERHGVPAKDIGRYNPRGRMGWNDELLVGSRTSEPDEVTERLVRDAEMRVSEDGEVIAEDERVPVERPLPRRTEADEKNDVRRLDRALDRTLYLVVRRGEGEKATWGFPSGDVPTHENLHEAYIYSFLLQSTLNMFANYLVLQTALRVLAESAGVNMNTWIVGRVPVAHHVRDPVVGADGKEAPRSGEKVFFLKGRIMAGQADLKGNRHGLTDFKWLTQDELRTELPADYFRSVRNMFADR
ncbi:39S mitochondrial ribosomal protein L46-domain-containing protein [Cercophora scortea]|uniref:Large ribosomal subunit protein mL46 n=1 Tax=Cercophora scortea TaxID=314031 RepID=A0AAE0MIS7_9PEZI|nr:39S mitochondrial ribosomal protein L46-domain-containing protein [Cercophora scortea]